MNATETSWLVSAVVLVALAALVGFAVPSKKGPWGILIDDRGRFSLSHLQITLWTLVVLSLVSGIFFGRLVHDVADPLEFSIPDNVLGLLGIAAGSTVAAIVTKSAKDSTGAATRIAVSGDQDRPRPAQIFLLEEGIYADKVIDITKFQNFVITLVLVVAYVALGIHAVDTTPASEIKGLPDFSGTFLTLLAISHASYIGGKLPNRAGDPPGMTVQNRAAVVAGAPPPGFAARNAP